MFKINASLTRKDVPAAGRGAGDGRHRVTSAGGGIGGPVGAGGERRRGRRRRRLTKRPGAGVKKKNFYNSCDKSYSEFR